MDTVLNFLFSGVSACFHWLGKVMNSISGAYSLWLGMVAIYLSYRFLLHPLLGGKSIGSDRAKKSKQSSRTTEG